MPKDVIIAASFASFLGKLKTFPLCRSYDVSVDCISAYMFCFKFLLVKAFYILVIVLHGCTLVFEVLCAYITSNFSRP